VSPLYGSRAFFFPTSLIDARQVVVGYVLRFVRRGDCTAGTDPEVRCEHRAELDIVQVQFIHCSSCPVELSSVHCFEKNLFV
jgi:hypothetical protein